MERHANSRYWEGSRAAAASGLWPHQVVLAAEQVLYRFVDLTRTPAAHAADGPWWFSFEDFQRIRHFALQHRYPLGYSARLFAAVLYEWSAVNGVVRARVASGPLLAWKGLGKPVLATGSDCRDVSVPHGLLTGDGTASPTMTPMTGPQAVYQLYIPGLGKPHHAPGLMQMISVERIAS